MTAVLTATGPATAARRPAERRTQPVRAADARAGRSGSPRGAFRLTPPESVTAWTAQLPSLPSDPDVATVNAVVAGVRDGLSRDEVLALAGVPVPVVVDIVVDLGSKCAQMNKRGPKIKSIRRGSAGERASFTRDGDVVSVRTAAGWAGEDGAADIRRAYAALLSSDETLVLNAVARWSEAHVAEQPLTYTHIADLYSSARGLLPQLHLVIEHPSSVRAYLKAWRLLDDAAHEAMTAIAHLTSGHARPDTARAAVRSAFGCCRRPPTSTGSPPPSSPPRPGPSGWPPRAASTRPSPSCARTSRPARRASCPAPSRT